MATTAESNITKYQVDDATMEQFQNITDFAKNMVLKKNSKELTYAETLRSKKFGDLLLKYVDAALSYEDVDDLIELVNNHNTEIDDIKSAVFSGSTDDDYINYRKRFLSFFNLSKDDPFEDSFVSIIAETFVELLKEKDQNNNFKRIDIEKYIVKTVFGEINLKPVKKSSESETSENNSTNSKTLKDFLVENKSLTNIENLISEIENNTTKTEDSNTSDTTTNENTSSSSSDNSNQLDDIVKISSINLAYETLIEKEKIYSSQTSITNVSDVEEKLSASELEKTNINLGEELIFFDITYLNNNVKKEFKNVLNSARTENLSLTAATSNKTRIIILYKELNKEYRKILQSDIIDIAVNHFKTDGTTNIKQCISLFKQDDYGVITASAMRYPRLVDDTDILIKDFYDGKGTLTLEKGMKINYNNKEYIYNDVDDKKGFYYNGTEKLVLISGLQIIDNDGYIYTSTNENGEYIFVNRYISKTTKTFKYYYANAYLARKALQSDIVGYYIENASQYKYLTHGYGIYQYQKEEIYSFIAIYKEIRDYYYKVLLNEAFINEKDYIGYEEIFITCCAIERFLASKIDYLKDINLFNKTDIKNFFVSYGMGDLSELIDKSDFYESEEFSKRLIKSYVILMQNKGSRQVISDLQNIFSISDVEFTIFKTALIKTINSDSNPEYKFIKIPYDQTNVITAINSNIQDATDMNDFVSEDIVKAYWDKNTITNELLNSRGLDYTISKYLIPEMRVEISKKYFITRYLFAIIDAIFEKYKPKKDEDKTDTDKKNDAIFEDQFKANTDLSFIEFIDLIRYSYSEVLKNAMDKSDAPLNAEKIIYRLKNNIGAFNTKLNVDTSIFYTANNTSALLESQKGKIEKIIAGLNLLSILLTTEDLSKVVDDNTTITSIIASALDALEYILNGEYLQLQDLNETGREFFTSIRDYFIDSLTVTENSILPIQIRYEQEESFIESKINSLYANTDPESILIDLCSKLNDILNQSYIQLSFNNNENSLIKFLQTAIEYFISYTSQIYSINYINSYDNDSETIDIVDEVSIKIEDLQVDSFYYDEQLEIIVEPKN